MDTKGITMHIDRTYQVTVARKPAGAARPISAFGLMMMPTYRTPARCSSFGAGEARDAGLFGFVTEVVDVFPIFPLSHTAIVMAPGIPAAHAMRIADEEHRYLMLDAEVDDRPGRLMAHVSDTPLSSPADLVLGPLQLLPAARMLLAAVLLFGKLAQLLVALSLERADTTPSDDQGLPGIRRHRRQMDFAQVYRCLRLPRGLFRL